jgi:hypothetical protein
MIDLMPTLWLILIVVGVLIAIGAGLRLWFAQSPRRSRKDSV